MEACYSEPVLTSIIINCILISHLTYLAKSRWLTNFYDLTLQAQLYNQKRPRSSTLVQISMSKCPSGFYPRNFETAQKKAEKFLFDATIWSFENILKLLERKEYVCWFASTFHRLNGGKILFRPVSLPTPWFKNRQSLTFSPRNESSN